MSVRAFFLLILVVLVAIRPGSAQHVHHKPEHTVITDSSTLAFIESVRQATKKYQRLQEAITAGYRPIGPDMPNMGQHWIHTEFARRRQINPARPGMLTYLRVDSVDVLTGVAFTQPVLQGETPPEMPYQGAMWHYHFRTLETEAIRPPHHEDPHEGPRLAMLHAWVWSENPDGVFAADNWALPYDRLGFEAPENVTPASAKALFLLDGGVAFYTSMASKVAGIDGEDLEVVQAGLEHAREQVKSITKDFNGTPVEMDEQLATVWYELQDRVAKDLGRKKWKVVGLILE